MLKQETVSTKDAIYLLSDYEIENYGESAFSSSPQAKSGEFRSLRSMIPFDFLDKTARDFDWSIYGDNDPDAKEGRKLANAFVLNFHKWKQRGKGLYIYSSTKGTGKTYLSFCLANEVMNRYDVNVKFISVLDYLDLTRKGYNSMADKEEKDGIAKAAVLILDDIGVEINREWVNTTLYQLINYRYLDRLVTIITSNHPPERLKADDRLKSRIDEMCLPLHIPEVSIRAMKTDKQNREFIHEVLKTESPYQSGNSDKGQ